MICNCAMSGTSACKNCPTKQWEDEGRFPSRVFFAYGVDAVPVVRCKDCVHFSMGSKEFGIENDCSFHEWYRAEPKENDFCSRGERKE